MLALRPTVAGDLGLMRQRELVGIGDVRALGDRSLLFYTSYSLINLTLNMTKMKMMIGRVCILLLMSQPGRRSKIKIQMIIIEIEL